MLQKHFDENLPTLFRPGDLRPKVLLGVSGGMDSMCMATLFLNSVHHLPFGIAHVNFQLRGEDSDRDEALVEAWARRHGIEYFCTHFDTPAYARERGLSTEMAARELRYGWFRQLMEEQGYGYLSIAHNQNDSAETLFLNLLRGAGINGLTGIRRVHGPVIRPLLDISRAGIEAYVREHQIGYRDDLTNFETRFSRNRIRNTVFPELEKINPSFLNSITRSAAYLLQARKVLEQLCEQKQGSLFTRCGEELTIDIQALNREASPEYWLFTLLEKKGFNSAQIAELQAALNGQSGKTFRSRTHELVINRGVLQVYPLEKEDDAELLIDGPGTYSYKGIAFRLEVFPVEEGFRPAPARGELYFDADAVSWPLRCRSWKAADRFRPFGMRSGFQKISDLFTDLKLDSREKAHRPLLFSGTEIVCLPGLKSDDRYRIKNHTRRAGMVSVLP